MTPEEREDALELVNDLQRTRSGAVLANEGASRIPHILLPYQKRWHLDTSVVRICEKGRRVGFTWGAWAAEAALEAARANGGMDQFYMGYNQGMAAEFIGDCAMFAKWYGVICSDISVGFQQIVIENEKRDIVTYKINFASGHKIEALSSMPHNWRGRQGHARIDEAKDHMNLIAVVTGALAYRIWGGRISIGGTVGGEDNQFTDLLKQVKRKSLPWSLHTVRFSDAVSEGLYKRICLVTKQVWSPEAEATFMEETRGDYTSAEFADSELECIPLRGSGVYFSRLLLEKCASDGCDVLRFAQRAEFVTEPDRLAITQQWIDDVLAPRVALLPPDRRTVFGQDFGRDGDLSAIVIGQEERTGVWRTPLRLELRRIPFDCQKKIVLWLGHHLPLWQHAKLDARGNGQSHAEAMAQEFGGTRVECVMLTPKWYDTQWPRYHQAYEDGDIQTFGDEDWYQDHRSVVLSNGQARVSDARVKGSDGFDRHGDAAIAGLLMWAATRVDVPPAAGATVEPTRARSGRLGEPQASVFGGRAAAAQRARYGPQGARRGGGRQDGL